MVMVLLAYHHPILNMVCSGDDNDNDYDDRDEMMMMISRSGH